MIATITMDERLTTSETAARLGISSAAVKKAIYTGRLPAMRCGLGWLLDPEDVRRLAEQREARRLARV